VLDASGSMWGQIDGKTKANRTSADRRDGALSRGSGIAEPTDEDLAQERLVYLLRGRRARRLGQEADVLRLLALL
jgi:hypothetical protein